mmetsp:Transcript_19737/g.27099  ORF Transcript_19737/g.27099 Transcript_19737/m.27099 type:complete len:90 (-) Transcript_19737:300-569(-)
MIPLCLPLMQMQQQQVNRRDSKIQKKYQSKQKKKKKYLSPALRGQLGAQWEKKKIAKAKSRGQWKDGVKVVGKGKRKTRAPRKKQMCKF